jgi:hypothetical protein
MKSSKYYCIIINNTFLLIVSIIHLGSYNTIS